VAAVAFDATRSAVVAAVAVENPLCYVANVEKVRNVATATRPILGTFSTIWLIFKVRRIEAGLPTIPYL